MKVETKTCNDTETNTIDVPQQNIHLIRKYSVIMKNLTQGTTETNTIGVLQQNIHLTYKHNAESRKCIVMKAGMQQTPR